ncbi:hypothetical protein HNP55_000823 [Paucibacter oligotrophus]|uniref:Secreted protein with PEP-CTERM sorting signal n=1 Tax=Roseateles oligotrophus TaxID=1769250 RepID=A0A840L7X5_9BURK|nr:hypothetical protein [Roseateles oligotrophus]MBB4842328.1 hypothetical protein [Roseateles oligotrophus]
MRNKKTMYAAVASLLLTALGQAVAGPILLSASAPAQFGKDNIKFTAQTQDSYSLRLAQAGMVSGSLQTLGMGAALPSIDISSAYLLKSDGVTRVDFTESRAGNWSNGLNWVEQWNLAPVNLSAGDWTLIVVEQGWGSKHYSAYQGGLSLVPSSNTVPEPQMAVLSLTALAAMGLVLRKRRKA